MKKTDTQIYDEGAWDFLDKAENAVSGNISELLSAYRLPLSKLYSAAFTIAFLAQDSAKKDEVPEICARVSGIFFKRVLNDLRAIWALARIGYTTQSACVAAALFENALVVCATSENPTRAHQLKNCGKGKIPWGALQLCRIESERTTPNISEKDSRSRKIRLRDSTEQIYVLYRWLCQFKHPTWQSVLHDANAASIVEKEYVVMIMPDIRDEDLPNKKRILLISIYRAYAATEAFLRSRRADVRDPNYIKVRSALDEVRSIVWDLLKSKDAGIPG